MLGGGVGNGVAQQAQQTQLGDGTGTIFETSVDNNYTNREDVLMVELSVHLEATKSKPFECLSFILFLCY